MCARLPTYRVQTDATKNREEWKQNSGKSDLKFFKKTSSNLCGATKAVCGFERWGRRRAGGGGGGIVARWR